MPANAGRIPKSQVSNVSGIAQAQQGFFDDVREVEEVNNPWNDGAPKISDDGLTLYFNSARPGGLGGQPS